MQWVSTFAYGASSLGRSRRLEVRPAESGPPSSRGKFGENAPHLLGNIVKGKSKKVFSERLGTRSGSSYCVAGTKRNPAIMFLAELALEAVRVGHFVVDPTMLASIQRPQSEC